MGDGGEPGKVCLYSKIEDPFSSLIDPSKLETCSGCNGNGEAITCTFPEKYLVPENEKNERLMDRLEINRLNFEGNRPSYSDPKS